MASRKILIALGVAALMAAAGLAVANLFLGDLNQDEGWYLNAARLVHGGRQPYRDFAFTQGPVMAWTYGAAWPVIERFGVAGGRALTAGLGLAAALVAALLARRLAPVGARGAAGLCAFMLAAVNVYQSYFCTVVKTYALVALLVGLAFLALSGIRADARSRWRMAALAALAGAVFALAAATRISAGFMIPLVTVWLWLRRREQGVAVVVGFVLGAGATLACVFLPFVIQSWEALRFGLLEYHAARRPGSLGMALALKIGSICRLAQAYPVVLGVAAALGVVWVVKRDWLKEQERDDARLPLLGLMLASVAGVGLVHWAAPFPYDDYQVTLAPLLATVLAVGLVRVADRLQAVVPATVVLGLISVVGVCGSPMIQNWFIRGQDRIWWRMKTRPPLAVLQSVAREVKAMAGADRRLLTQDLYLAVEAGLEVPDGMALGPFCYYPGWDTARAGRLHVLNRERLAALLEQDPPSIAVFSGYGLAIRAPEVTELTREEQADLWELVNRRYAVAAEFPEFGQAATVLKVMRRKGLETSP